LRGVPNTKSILATFAFAVVAVASVIGPAAASSTTVLRLDGIGPLKLGMSLSAALATGWLAHRGSGCELNGPPVPVTYSFTGAKAPGGLSGVAQFSEGRLTEMSFSRGVHTAAGVSVGQTTVARTVARYRGLSGYGASSAFSPTIQATFVDVKRNGRQVLGAVAEHSTVTTLAIPSVTTCE